VVTAAAMPSSVLERLAEQMQVADIGQEGGPLRAEGSAGSKGAVTLLDYGAGNVRSVRNAIVRCGFDVVEVTSPEDVLTAEKLIFPGVGSFGFCMGQLEKSGYSEVLKQRIAENRPLLGVCLGMQLFFEESEESPGVAGLGVIPGKVTRFDEKAVESIPHMGWNGARTIRPGSSTLLDGMLDERGYTDKIYFVHSYRAMLSEDNADWVLTMTDYGDASQSFVSSVQKGNVMATQFHPEKSGEVGLKMFNNFLSAAAIVSPPPAVLPLPAAERTILARRVIACLDVRSNDAGDLVVTKGDQYDVREKDDGGEVRNLGKPVELAGRCVLAASLCASRFCVPLTWPVRALPATTTRVQTRLRS
jgi:glutamine amidotransferase/cyclase